MKYNGKQVTVPSESEETTMGVEIALLLLGNTNVPRLEKYLIKNNLVLVVRGE